MTAILGISAFYHDSAAVLVVDGEIVAAAEEERFSRKKHDAGFPLQAIEYCLAAGKIGPEQIDFVGFYDKPLLKFDRLLETYLAFAPRGFRSFAQAMPLWLRQKLHLKRELDRGLRHAYRKRYVFTHHHESHAASAFFPSPFEEAAILTLDGVGEWSTATMGSGHGNRIALTHELRFPHSLGLLYSAFTYFTGFKVNSDEYKLMGLAPYGEPRFVDLLLEKVVHVRDDGSLHMDLSYFDYCHGLTMTSRKMDALFGGPPRAPEAPITQRDMDLAASIQKLTEEVVLRCARTLQTRTGLRKLCLAGGVALNCVANGRLLREGPFEDVWVQPAAGDAGGALGVALFIWHQLLDRPRVAGRRDRMQGALLGPRFDDDTIRRFLDTTGAHYERIDDDDALVSRVAAGLDAGAVTGWFQGRMEFGPRALGSRSILADARRAEMQATVNQKVKFREGFRPFAPAVLEEHVDAWFETRPCEDTPYMLLVAPVRESKRVPGTAEPARGLDKLKVRRSVVPAITHVDHSARIQTVDADRHGAYRRLLEAFHDRTGCPILVNTSFNLAWDPIVCTPRDAYETFMASNLDVLCIGHQLLEKTAQPAWSTSAPDDVPDEVLEPLLQSPCCGAAFERRPAERLCGGCGRAYAIDAGIARLALATPAGGAEPTDIGDEPGSVRALLDRGRRDPAARALDTSIPYNSRVLEVGCGSGMLTNLLGVGCRRVVGADTSIRALQVAEGFRSRHELSRVRFVEMRPEAPCFVPQGFDVLVFAPRHRGELEALARLVPLVRPGGHVVVTSSDAAIGDVFRRFVAQGLELGRGWPTLRSGAEDLEHGGLLQPGAPSSRLEIAVAEARRHLARRGARGTVLGARRFLLVGRRPELAHGAAPPRPATTRER